MQSAQDNDERKLQLLDYLKQINTQRLTKAFRAANHFGTAPVVLYINAVHINDLARELATPASLTTISKRQLLVYNDEQQFVMLDIEQLPRKVAADKDQIAQSVIPPKTIILLHASNAQALATEVLPHLQAATVKHIVQEGTSESMYPLYAAEVLERTPHAHHLTIAEITSLTTPHKDFIQQLPPRQSPKAVRPDAKTAYIAQLSVEQARLQKLHDDRKSKYGFLHTSASFFKSLVAPTTAHHIQAINKLVIALQGNMAAPLTKHEATVLKNEKKLAGQVFKKATEEKLIHPTVLENSHRFKK